jgi:glycosyltransferase involved in cell wall biosynthesis
MIELSVIIPIAREQEKTTCLDSLAAQNINKDLFEVILIGERLDDNNVYADKLNIKILSCENKHPSVRRNLGAKESSGKSLVFLDDDTRVDSNFLGNVLEKLQENPGYIISGANRDNRTGFKIELPSAIQENFLTEGLSSHRNSNKDNLNVNRHNIPLCNWALSREIYNAVGGFNEFASYYIDDAEFLYIAEKIGVKFASFTDLNVQHDIRPFWKEYYKYKFFSRYKIGEIFPFYPELYIDCFQIKLVLSSYILLLAIIIFQMFYLLYALAGGYLLLLVFAVLTSKSRLPVKSVLAPALFVTHICIYTGFSIGVVKGIIDLMPKKNVLKLKKKRYSVINK